MEILQSMQTWGEMWANSGVEGTDIILVFFAYFAQPLDFSNIHSCHCNKLVALSKTAEQNVCSWYVLHSCNSYNAI